MRFFLIGISHGYQYDGNNDVDTASFHKMLVEKYNKYCPELIAEELNEERIEENRKNGVVGSIAKNVSKCVGIAHMFCDPTRSKREKLGIPSQDKIKKDLGFATLLILNPDQLKAIREKEKEYWHIREKFWLRLLMNTSANTTMFILGADHVHRFKDLAKSHCIEVNILYDHWAP